MAQDETGNKAIEASLATGNGAPPPTHRPGFPPPIGLGIAGVFYLLTLLPTRRDTLFKAWPEYLLPVARIEMFFPTTNGHLIAMFVLAVAGALHVRARRRAIRAFPGIVRSDRGISHAGPLSRHHLPLGWSITWPLQLFSVITVHAGLLLGSSDTLAFWGWLLLLAPAPLAVVLLRRHLRLAYGVPVTGLAWRFLWRWVLVLVVASASRFGLVAAIGTALHSNELPLYLWAGVWALQIAVECFGFGWAGHQAVIGRVRAQQNQLTRADEAPAA